MPTEIFIAMINIPSLSIGFGIGLAVGAVIVALGASQQYMKGYKDRQAEEKRCSTK